MKSINKKSILSTIFIYCLISFCFISNAYAYNCIANNNPPEKHIFGIAIQPKYNNKSAELLSELGTKWVRYEFRWDDIENKKGKFFWKEYDDFVKSMQQRNIKILAVITDIPEWIKTEKELEKHLTIFIDNLVKRYKPRGKLAKQNNWHNFGISYWEIFGKPNIEENIRIEKSNNDYIDIYASILKTANWSIRKNHPNAFIIIGGLTSKGIPAKKYLDRLYLNSVHKCYDIFSYHLHDTPANMEKLKKLTNALFKSYGKNEKPVWFTEFRTSDEKAKPEIITKIFVQQDKWDAIFWFTLKDKKRWDWNYGLVDYLWSPKPSFFEIKKSIERYNMKQ